MFQSDRTVSLFAAFGRFGHKVVIWQFSGTKPPCECTGSARPRVGVVTAVFCTLSHNQHSTFFLDQNAEKEPGHRDGRALHGGAHASAPGLAQHFDAVQELKADITTDFPVAVLCTVAHRVMGALPSVQTSTPISCPQ